MRPRASLVIGLAGWTGVGVAAAWIPELEAAWRTIGVLLAALAAADLVLLRRLPSPTLLGRTHGALALRRPGRVRLTLHNPSSERLRFRLHDLHPADFPVVGQPCEVDLEGRHGLQLEYDLLPTQRGDFPMAGSRIALRSPLGLWTQVRHLACATRLRVVPDLPGLGAFGLFHPRDPRLRAGEHRTPRRGEGATFHQLRDYRQGDQLRRIDWKATARMRKLIAREYQDERDLSLVFLLDTGRRMRHAEGDGPAHLDQALSAVLTVADLAQRRGDAVGLLTYGGSRRWLPPRRESRTRGRLLASLYDLQPTLAADDHLAAALELGYRLRRRALVVLITTGRDEDRPELEQAARLLRRRHRLVIADLRESVLDRSLDAEIRTRSDALRFHAVQDWLARRREQHEGLRRLGIEVLDVVPARLPAALADRYLVARRRAAG